MGDLVEREDILWAASRCERGDVVPASEAMGSGYRMEGADWVDAAADWTATYANPPTGQYVFRVRGPSGLGAGAIVGGGAVPATQAWWVQVLHAVLAAGRTAAAAWRAALDTAITTPQALPRHRARIRRRPLRVGRKPRRLCSTGWLALAGGAYAARKLRQGSAE